MPTKTPIDPGMIARAVAGVWCYPKYSGAVSNTFFILNQSAR